MRDGIKLVPAIRDDLVEIAKELGIEFVVIKDREFWRSQFY